MRLTIKGQVTVPKNVRERLGLVAGSEVEFTVRGDQAVMRPRGAARFEKALRRWHGYLKRKGRRMDVDRYLNEIRGRVDHRD